MKNDKKMHPGINDLKDYLQKWKITRREFIRYAGLLGLFVGAAGQMEGLVFPGKAYAATPQRGGTLKISSQVHNRPSGQIFMDRSIESDSPGR